MEKDNIKRRGRRRKRFNWFAFAVVILIIIIALCMFIVFKPDDLNIGETFGQITDKIGGKITEITTTEFKEEDARKKAVNKFEELGERIAEEDLSVVIVTRNGEDYYFIQGKKNTMEIQKSTGKITRLNAKVVEE